MTSDTALGARRTAQEDVLRHALRVLTAERELPRRGSVPDITKAEDQLALAARELARSVDALPPEKQPKGWTGGGT